MGDPPPDGRVGWVLDPHGQGPGFESRLATLSGSDTRSRCQRFGFPRRFGLRGGISGPRFRLVAASYWRPAPEGCRSQLPAGALVHHRGPLSSRSAPTRRKEEDALEDALEDAEIPAAHLKRRRPE